MADEPAVEDLPISVPTNLDEVDALFARKRKLKPKIDEATAQLQAIRANALSLQKTVVSPLLIKRFLAAFGVVVARFEHLNINVEGFKDPIKLYRRRYFGPLRQK